MANEHPFQMLFETLGRVPVAHADSVNRKAYELLHDLLSVPVEKSGRCILLRAPRAGHGKTHLLSRIQHNLGATHEFIPLHPAFGCQIDASTVIDDTLRRLLRPLPASGGLCVLDLVTRKLFAAALQPLVGSGEVPCQDREGALMALRTRPIETFDFHHPNAVTAHWARENFEVLGQRLSVELAQRCDLQIREVSFWVEALFRFAATPVDNPVRLRVLAEVVHAGNPGDGVLMERLEALLGMLAQLMRVVLVADDLEGFSADESAALRLASFLGSLRQSVERLDVILSLNQDIWQSAFLPRLSGGLTDRLSEVVVELNPLTEDEMVALLESRVPGLGARVLSRVDRESSGTHARGLIRAAGVAWLRASAMDSQAAPSAAEVVPAPVAVPEPELEPEPVAIPESKPAEMPEPVMFSAPPVEPVVPVVEEAPVFQPAVEPSPEPEVPATPPAEAIPEPQLMPEPEIIPEPPAIPDPPVERAPDPTLAISFLAAEAAAAAARSEPVVPNIAPETYSFEPAPASFEPAPPTFEPAPASFEAAPASFEPAPASFEPTPASFEPAPASFEPAPASFEPAPASFEPAPASFEPAPAPFEPAPAAFEPTPSPFESAPAPVEPTPQTFEPEPVPDTDRVDDLLRQFRERYGKGSM